MKKLKIIIVCITSICMLCIFSSCNKQANNESIENDKAQEVTENNTISNDSGMCTEFNDIEFSVGEYKLSDSTIDEGDNYKFVSLEYTDGVHIISTMNSNPIKDWNTEFEGVSGKIDTMKKDGVEIHIISDEEDPEYPIYGIEFNYKDYGYEIATDDPKAKDLILKTLKFK